MSAEFNVCGLEHTGTTLISELFRQIPGLDSGFEVGVLLTENPGDFKTLDPFASNMLEGWGITEEEFHQCCDEPDYASFYRTLKKASRSIADDCESIFDKTPRYFSQLSSCLERSDKPFVVSYKDPRAIVHSDFKRAKTDDFYAWYKSYNERKRQYVSLCYGEHQKNKDNPRVEFVSLEELALNARSSMERIFAHIGHDFSLDYVVLNGVRYKNTRSNAVSIPIAFSYLGDFDDEINSLIADDFAEFSDWFYT